MRNPFDVPPLRYDPREKGELWGATIEQDAPRLFDFDASSDSIPTGRKLALAFHGHTSGYFRIWSVCQFLTIITLGLYGPWARVRKAEYLAKQWALDGHRFSIQLDAPALFRGRLFVFGSLSFITVMSWYQPFLVPIFTLITFAGLPWLLTNSFAFRWQTITFRNQRFGFQTNPTTLMRPIYRLMIAVALSVTPGAVWYSIFGPTTWVVAISPLLILPTLYFWPKATAAFTHHRFANARWGSTPFDLDASVQDVVSITFKAMWSGRIFLAMFLYMFVLIIILILVRDQDLLVIFKALGFLLITVFSITFGRTRRLNYILHRLRIGGNKNGIIQIATTLDPIKQGFLTIRYTLMIILSFGLLTPWATIHYARWRARHVQFYLDGDWPEINGDVQQKVTHGAWDELANSFDIEIGI